MKSTVPRAYSPDTLTKMGFAAVVLSSKKFNVICVTKYCLDTERPHMFHLNPDGVSKRYSPEDVVNTVEIEVKLMFYSRNDISFAETVVAYKGKDYLMESVRNGISGSALVIGIYNEDHVGYGVWHLYTDTPSAIPDRPGEVVTSEELRKHARGIMEKNFR